MAEVKLARGTDRVIRKGTGLAGGVNGKIYVSTDRYKIYTDVSDTQRVELNQGIALNTMVTFVENASTTVVDLKDEIGALNLQDPNFVIMVYGNQQDYYDLGVSCTNAEEQKLTFTIGTPVAGPVSFSVSIFIYDGVAGLRNFKVAQRDESPTINIDPSGWEATEEGYSYKINNPELTENSLVMFGSTDADGGFAYVTSANTTNGALIVNASAKPVEDVGIYIQQLPEGSKQVIANIEPTQSLETQEGYVVNYPVEGLEENIVLIQCISGLDQYYQINNIDTTNSTLNLYSADPLEESLELQIILIPNDALVTTEVTLNAAEWTTVATDSEYYFQVKTLDTPLQCGGENKDYSSIPVITCIENERGYAAITKIEISEDRTKLNCVANLPITQDIVIEIVDFQS